MVHSGGQKRPGKQRPSSASRTPDVKAIGTREIRAGIEQLRSRMKPEEFIVLKPKDVCIDLLRERRLLFRGRRYGHDGLHAPDRSQATLLSTLLSAAKKMPSASIPNTMPANIIVEAARLNQEFGPRQAAAVLRAAGTLLEAAGDALAAKKRLDSTLRFLGAAGGVEQAIQAIATAAAVAEVTSDARPADRR
jgi:hypothetical protein